MSKRRPKKKGHFGAFLLGLIIVGFAVFGAYKAVTIGMEKASTMVGDSKKIAEYEKFLEPFVVVDPEPFDDINSANSIDLLDAAIGSLIQNSDNNYPLYEGEVTGLLVPQDEVEKYFIKLFGKEVKLVHMAVENSFYNVLYNSQKKAYVIPITSVDPTYTPKIYDIKKTGSSIVLTVGYIGGTEWAQLIKKDKNDKGVYEAPEPGKFMKITLREDGDNYHIGALQTTVSEDTARTQTTAVPTTDTATTAAVTETQERQTGMAVQTTSALRAATTSAGTADESSTGEDGTEISAVG
ncbi:MAG: hypothetical protein K6F09_02380 [Clostridiales bacterium]|nr:hypothetical protein [Clostridiales bacterium]